MRTVLIAGRGEIAVRTARSCRELGLRTVAAYSTADREAEVLGLVDEVVLAGTWAPGGDCLNARDVIEAARLTGADAIHPGDGSLSEDPDLADVCAAEGITLVGPPAAVREEIADRARVRRLMAAAGLPVLPGSPDAVTTLAEARRAASEIGFPIVLKAVAGGCGTGMDTVHVPEEFSRAYRRARARAQAFPGDGRVYLERFVENARRIGIQVLCDRHGNAVHLGERDGSVAQRMGEAAVRGALAVGYVGAGTFEFLLDQAGRFHFVGVSCRTGLVREQLLIAAGEPLRGAPGIRGTDPVTGVLAAASSRPTFQADSS